MERIAVVLLISMIAFACERDPYFGPVYLDQGDSLTIDTLDEVMLIGCEGNFQLGNASLSSVNLVSGTVQNNIFESVNQAPLGDVLQSIYRSGDSLYLILNGSGVVHIVDPQSLDHIAQIDALGSPRYMVVHKQQALFTDLFSDKIDVVDLTTLSKSGELEGGGWTEKIIQFQNQIIVGDLDANQLIVFDSKNLERSLISLDFEPRVIETEGEQLMVAGNTKSNGGKGVVALFDAEMNQLDTTHTSRITDAVIKEGMIYLLLNKTVSIVDQLSLAHLESVPLEVETPYSIGLHPRSEALYVCDVKDYISPGEVYVYDLINKRWGKSFIVGQIPQAIYFTF